MGIVSYNNRLVTEAYQKEGLRGEVKSGFLTVGQKTNSVGLRVLVDAKLNDGSTILAGSIAYIKEELLHTQVWAAKALKCDSIGESYLVIEMIHVDFIKPSET